MNGSQPPGPPGNTVDNDNDRGDKPAELNGHRSPAGDEESTKTSPDTTTTAQDDSISEPSRAGAERKPIAANGAEDDANSEAETLIDSPVKKKEAETQAAAAAAAAAAGGKQTKTQRSRIGGLPVPSGDDDEMNSLASPMQSTETSEMKATSSGDAKEEGLDVDLISDRENSSGPLSSISNPASRASSRSRALSERPDLSRNSPDPSNPRKRKHRASSVTLPNKRQSMEPPKRRLRGMHSEDHAGHADRSPSPGARGHRRAVSTQSAFMDAGTEGSSRKRRSVTQLPVRELKTTKSSWEESDASSEATSHGHTDQRRPQRGIGRSTSIPGRPIGREHKRHVNKYGFTRLAEACEEGNLDLVKEWREKDPDQLELAEYAGNKPLQIAALNGNDEVVEYLIDQGCQIHCANVDKDTPLIDAAENGHLGVVRVLLKAGVDPIRQNLKGQQAMDVVKDEEDDADEIRAALREAIENWHSSDAKQRREEEEELRHRERPNKELHFMARTYENLLRLVQTNDRTAVREFLDARVPVDNAVIAAAAKTGDLYLVNMLLAEMTEKKAWQKAEKPMLGVLGSSHWEMVKSLTELEQFNPLWQSRAGKTWPQLAEERNGPNARQEMDLLQRLFDERAQSMGHRSLSPSTHRDTTTKSRRFPKPHEDESDEEGAPKRKNIRRLMSRRDMRAASGRAVSEDESDEDSTSEGARDQDAELPEEEQPKRRIMGSPASKRGPSRPRTKSISSQPLEASSPMSRRRSSSLRGIADKHPPSEQSLPTVDEKAEDKDDAEKVKAEQEKKEREQQVLEEAEMLEAKRRKEEVEAEAEAKRVQVETERAEVERRVEEERKRREEEDARRAEEERKAEEERQRVQAELEEARRKHRREVLASLPPTVAYVLDAESDFKFQGLQDLSYLLEHLTPLVLFKRQITTPAYLSFRSEEQCMLNVQAAPLLGKRGMEVLLRPESTGFERTFSAGWTARIELSEKDHVHVKRILADLTSRLPLADGTVDGDVDMDGKGSFESELNRSAERINAALEARRRGEEEMGALYLIRLQDVLENLDPLLRDVPMQILFFNSPPQSSAESLQKLETADFAFRLQNAWTTHPLFGQCRSGQGQHIARVDEATGVTEIAVVREK